MEIKKDLRQVLRNNKVKLKERIREFEIAYKNNKRDEARFWWAKILRRIDALNNIIDSLAKEPDTVHPLSGVSPLSNKQHAINSRQKLFLIQKSLDKYSEEFKNVSKNFGFKASSYGAFLKFNKQ